MNKTFTVLFMIFSIQASFGSDGFKRFNKSVKGQLPYFLIKDIQPIWNVTKIDQAKLIKLPRHQLKNQYGKQFDSNNLKGKVSALSFFFATCSGYCPLMTKNIKRAFVKVKDDKNFVFLSYSVTPSKDTVQILATYANDAGINNANWELLTGKRETIYNLARKYLFADLAIDLDKEEDQFVHSESIYLIDQNLFVRGIYNANKPQEIKTLYIDMKSLKN